MGIQAPARAFQPVISGCHKVGRDKNGRLESLCHHSHDIQNIAIGLIGEAVARGITSGAVINMNS